MSETDTGSESLKNDRKLCDEVTRILFILTNAEKHGKNLYNPLREVSGMVSDLKNEYLKYLNQRLLKGFRTATTDEQIWADCYFTFILELCRLHYETKWKIDHAGDDSLLSMLHERTSAAF